ncbi:MAG: GspH/FimT family pseudopilin [bacterium]
MSRSPGFTLIELMVALVIAGLMIATGLPAIERYRSTLALEQAHTQVLQDVRRARQLAVTRRAPVVIRFGAPPVTTNVTTYEIHVDSDADNLVDAGEMRTFRRLPRSTRLDSVEMPSQPDTVTFDISGTLKLGTQGGLLVVANRLGARDTLAISAAGICYEP